jgi:ketosteroid isomerase-like protein
MPNTRSLLVAVLLLLAGGGGSYAQQSDVEQQVKAAIDAYHAAIGSLDIAKMDPLWAHDGNVMLVNPRDKSVSLGWDAVRKNWEATFNNNSEIKVTEVEGPHIAANGDVAWSTGIANAVGELKSGASFNAPTFEVDVFEKRGGKWLLVSHTGLRVPQ